MATKKTGEVAVKRQPKSQVTAQRSREEKMKKDENMALLGTSPVANAAAVIEKYGKPFGELDWPSVGEVISDSVKQVREGDMSRVEEMLLTQAYAMQSIFMNFSRRALAQQYQKPMESFFRMAMKAQNQCRMTLETLANVKNPPVVYARQANIAHGPQQVNNGVSDSTRTREEKQIGTNELSGDANHVEILDTGTKGTTGQSHSPVETVEVGRSENVSR